MYVCLCVLCISCTQFSACAKQHSKDSQYTSGKCDQYLPKSSRALTVSRIKIIYTHVGMYLTQCERTAISFEMINKFYYYLSSLKVAASTLLHSRAEHRDTQRENTLTCRHARFTKSIHFRRGSECKRNSMRANKWDAVRNQATTKRKRRRSVCRGKANEWNHLPISHSHRSWEWIRLRNTNSHRMKFIFICWFVLHILLVLFLSLFLSRCVCVRAQNHSQFV